MYMLLVMSMWKVLVKQPSEVILCSLQQQLYQGAILLHALKNLITTKQLVMDECDSYTQNQACTGMLAK